MRRIESLVIPGRIRPSSGGVTNSFSVEFAFTVNELLFTFTSNVARDETHLPDR